MVKISSNLAYSWWVHPIAVKEGGTDNILYGGVTSSGDPRVFRKQPTDTIITDIENTILYDAQEADDHNSVSILSKAGKDLLVFWQRHGQSPYINYWRAPEGTFTFGAKSTITFPYNVTYCQTMTTNDKVILFTRCGNSYWYMTISNDWGATWSSPVMFLDASVQAGQIYLTTTPFDTDPTKFHLSIYGHPTSSTWRNVVYGTIDINSGDIANFTGVVGNLYTPNLPITPADLDIAWQPVGTVGEKVRLFDVSDKHGVTAILLGKWNNNTSIPQYYVAKRDSAGMWSNFKYRSSGGAFWALGQQNYTYGMAFDRNGNDWLYMGTKDTNGNYSMRKFDVNSDMTLSNETVLHNAIFPLARPYPVVGANAVIYQGIMEYADFSNYNISVYLKELL